MRTRSPNPDPRTRPGSARTRWLRRLEYGVLAVVASSSLLAALAVSEARASATPTWTVELARTIGFDDRPAWHVVAIHPAIGAGDGGAIVVRYAGDEPIDDVDALVDHRSILVVARSHVLDAWVVLSAADAWRDAPGIPISRLSDRAFVDAWRCDIDVRARLVRDDSFDRVTRAVQEGIDRIERICGGPGMSLRSDWVLDDGR